MSESPTPRIRSGSVPVARRAATRPGGAVVADGIVVVVATAAGRTAVDGTDVVETAADGTDVITATVLPVTLLAGAAGDEPASSGTEPTPRVI